MTTPWQVRLRYFLRSVLPADLGQLLFLAAVVCLIFAARMSWGPRHLGVPLESLGPLDNPQSRIDSYGLSVLGAWALILSSFGAYYVCFWPGAHPVRRLLFLVLLPAAVGIASFFGRFAYLAQPYSSALEADWSARLFRPDQFSSWIASSGFRVAFIGLLLIAIFSRRLLRGISSLPLSLRSASVTKFPDTELWRRTQFLAWVLVGPLFLPAAMFGVVLAGIVDAVASKPRAVFDSPYFSISTSLVEAIFLLAIVLLIVGKAGRKVLATSTRFSRPEYLFVAASFSIGIAVLISSTQYLLARAVWAATQFGSFAPPQAARYFGLPSPSLLSMFLGAFAEELVFRGFLQTIFIRRYSLYRGVFLTGVVWAAYHFQFDASFTHFDELGVVARVASRLSMCLALGFVLSWLTLRTSSIFPATMAHALYNVLVTDSGVAFQGRSTVWIGLWALLAYFLFRCWPVGRLEIPESGTPLATEPGIIS